jgi:hypothetical protein
MGVITGCEIFHERTQKGGEKFFDCILANDRLMSYAEWNDDN